MNIRDEILSKIHDGYLVGGAIRDALLDKTTTDKDIAIKGAENFAKKLAEEFNGTFITLDSENKIYRVVLEDKINFFDLSELQGETIQEDLKKRDFTINAIAYDLKTNEIIDITGGRKDLKNGILRHIDEKNFEEDPLRILRAFRFAATTGFKMTPELEEAIKKYLPLALNPAPERIHYEIMKLFGGAYTSQTLLKLNDFGLLERIFPCIIDMKKVPPNTHHHLDLFHHVVETVRQIEIQYANADEKIKEHLDRIDFGGFPRINHLKLAGFLHDIGKFSTWTIEGGKCDKFECLYNKPECVSCNARHRFIKHDDTGSKMVVPLLKELKFSKKQIEYISCMIKNHIYPSGVLAAPDFNEKVKMRYIRKMEDNVIDNIILACADRLSARGGDVTDEMVKNNLDGLEALLNFYLEKRETLEPLPKLLDGNEIMSILNIQPSPLLGKIVNALHEAQLNGDIIDKNQAAAFIKDFYNANI